MKVNTHKRRREARRREITERMKGVCACMKRERERERGERSERDAGRAQSRGGGVAAADGGSGSRPEVKALGESHFVSLHNTFRLFRYVIYREKRITDY